MHQWFMRAFVNEANLPLEISEKSKSKYLSVGSRVLLYFFKNTGNISKIFTLDLISFIHNFFFRTPNNQ